MQSEIEISLYILAAIFFGAILRMIYGWRKADASGEPWDTNKFVMSIIGTIIGSLAIFWWSSATSVQVDTGGFIGFLVTYAILGYIGEKYVGKILEAIGDKFGLGGGGQ